MKLPSGLTITLDHCHYDSCISVGIVSFSILRHSNYEPIFSNYGVFVHINNLFCLNDIPQNGIYKIEIHNDVLDKKKYTL